MLLPVLLPFLLMDNHQDKEPTQSHTLQQEVLIVPESDCRSCTNAVQNVYHTRAQIKFHLSFFT